MAIEIRQLVIRAVVDDGGRSSSARPDAEHPAPSIHTSTREQPAMLGAPGLGAPGLGADERQAIVNACVREVLRKLERARER